MFVEVSTPLARAAGTDHVVGPAPPGWSEVGAGALASLDRTLHAGPLPQLAHLGDLLAGHHLLGEQRGLDAVEESLDRKSTRLNSSH